MTNFFRTKKIVLIYFFYLIFNYILLLYFHLNEFPYKYVFTDWLINYEGGFIRRGLLGQIIYEVSLIFNVNFKEILFLMQATGYLLYFVLIINFFNKVKLNFFWLLLIFSTISFLYPISELEALGRKDIFVILLFLIFVQINFSSLNKFLTFFLIIFTISCLIHEITFFYLPYYLLIFLYNPQFKEKIKFIHAFLILISLIFLIYLNLIISNKANINEIISSYQILNIEITSNTGAFSWLTKPFMNHISIIQNQISLTGIIRFSYVILINVWIFFYFIKLKNTLSFSTLTITSNKIFIGLLLLAIPIYLIVLDWGRVTYLIFNFMIITIIFFKKKKLIDENFLQKKIDGLSIRIKSLIFILICILFSPKILANDDLSGIPLFKTINKFEGLINFFLFQ